MKAILQYTNFCGDGNVVHQILTTNNVKILKTSDAVVRPHITIMVTDYHELLSLLYELNKNCHGEVRLVRTKPDKTIFDCIKKILCG